MGDDRDLESSPIGLVEDLFRTEHAHLVAALTRTLGPSNVSLAEDVVQDALVSAMQAWRFGPPRDPKAWIVRAARNRAIDIIRRERHGASLLPELANLTAVTDTIDAALAPEADRENQLAMMFAVCDPVLTPETHVTMILRWLCGLSPKEIGQAFLVDPQTIDRRLHRGKARLRELPQLVDVDRRPDLEERQGSVLHALYLLFNEGYHGSNPREPVRPFLCIDALRLTELLLDAPGPADPDASALGALFCFDLARLPTRLDAEGVFVPLEEQDRARWDRVVAFYDLLMAQSPGPIVALNRALAVAERDGVEEGRRQLVAVAGEKKLAGYPFYWAALADLQRRADRHGEARSSYARAMELSRSPAERVAYRRRLDLLKTS